MPEEKIETVAETEPEGLDEFFDAYVEAALWSHRTRRRWRAARQEL